MRCAPPPFRHHGDATPEFVEELDRQQLVRCIDRFLQAKGIQRRQHFRAVEEILGMSYSHAHWLIQGTVDWTLPQLMQVARHYDMTLAEVIALLLGYPRPSGPRDGTMPTDAEAPHPKGDSS